MSHLHNPQWSRYDDAVSSTLECPCGESFTWEGFAGAELTVWCKRHARCRFPIPVAIAEQAREHRA